MAERHTHSFSDTDEDCESYHERLEYYFNVNKAEVQTLSRLTALPTVTKSRSWDGKMFAQISNDTIVKVRFADTVDEAILKHNGNCK